MSDKNNNFGNEEKRTLEALNLGGRDKKKLEKPKFFTSTMTEAQVLALLDADNNLKPSR